VLQESELDPNLTVRETVSLFAGFYPRRAPSTSAPARFRAAAVLALWGVWAAAFAARHSRWEPHTATA
jgi:ABC-type multidrug transport system ATPase subunit